MKSANNRFLSLPTYFIKVFESAARCIGARELAVNQCDFEFIADNFDCDYVCYFATTVIVYNQVPVLSCFNMLYHSCLNRISITVLALRFLFKINAIPVNDL